MIKTRISFGKTSLSNFLIMTVGVFLLTVGVYFFKIPNGFSTGGVSGIGTILGKVIPVEAVTRGSLSP